MKFLGLHSKVLRLQVVVRSGPATCPDLPEIILGLKAIVLELLLKFPELQEFPLELQANVPDLQAILL